MKKKVKNTPIIKNTGDLIQNKIAENNEKIDSIKDSVFMERCVALIGLSIFIIGAAVDSGNYQRFFHNMQLANAAQFTVCMLGFLGFATSAVFCAFDQEEALDRKKENKALEEVKKAYDVEKSLSEQRIPEAEAQKIFAQAMGFEIKSEGAMQQNAKTGVLNFSEGDFEHNFEDDIK